MLPWAALPGTCDWCLLPKDCRGWPRTEAVHACWPCLLQVLVVVAVWFVTWLLQRRPLPPHFAHYRLRLRGQLTTLLRLRR